MKIRLALSEPDEDRLAPLVVARDLGAQLLDARAELGRGRDRPRRREDQVGALRDQIEAEVLRQAFEVSLVEELDLDVGILLAELP